MASAIVLVDAGSRPISNHPIPEKHQLRGLQVTARRAAARPAFKALEKLAARPWLEWWVLVSEDRKRFIFQ